MLKSILLPIVTGVVLSACGGSSEPAKNADASEHAAERADDSAEKAEDKADRAADKAEEAADDAKEAKDK